MSEEEYTQRAVATETARATVNQAKAAVQMAELDLSYTKISAPIDGRISRTLVTEGNLVGYNESTVLTNIVRMDPIYVNFDVPEQYVVKYDQLARQLTSPGSKDLRIPVDVAVANEIGYPHAGSIDFRENRVDIGTGTIRLRGTVPNSDRSLYPGLYTRVRVPESAPQQRLMVPEASLMTDQRGRFLYVLKPDHSVEARTVSVGSKVGILIAIVTGLTADDTVIINGLQRARPGTKVDPQLVKLDEPRTGPTSPAKADDPATARPVIGASTKHEGGHGVDAAPNTKSNPAPPK
jgi:multidrug efflux system membrane fusion protein